MAGNVVALVEMLLVFGLVVGFGVWQLALLRRDQRDAASAPPPRHPEGQHEADPARADPVEHEALVHRRDRPPE